MKYFRLWVYQKTQSEVDVFETPPITPKSDNEANLQEKDVLDKIRVVDEVKRKFSGQF